MTKAELVNEVSDRTGIEKMIVLQTIEATMKVIKNQMLNKDNVYLRGFGSFILKRRAQKIGRIITKDQAIVIPEHCIPAFKPAKTFMERIKQNVKPSDIPSVNAKAAEEGGEEGAE